jgi:hypothetical protein
MALKTDNLIPIDQDSKIVEIAKIARVENNKIIDINNDEIAVEAGEAEQLANARTISFTNAVTGSFQFDGSSDVSVDLALNDVDQSKIINFEDITSSEAQDDWNGA